MTGQNIAVDPRWGEYPAGEWSDAIVQSMRLGGVERLYFVSGSEIGFYQESIARARKYGWPTPEIVMVTHESVALNAAIGEAMVSERPTATAAHVDVGTFNYGGALHTAWRGGFPVLITAGGPPRAYPGSMPGARSDAQVWVQEARDQSGILRDYTKMDHRLEHQDNPGFMISRLLQIMMSDPQGPAYLVLPPETAKLKMSGTTRFPTRDQLGVARPAWPDPADAKRVAEWLIKADNPCILTAKSGRHQESVADLVRLAQLLAVPVMDTGRWDHLNFPTRHPLSGTGPAPSDADVLLIFEAPVPFIPPRGPGRDAKIAWVDPDPVQSRYLTMEFGADLWLPVSTSGAANAISEAAMAMLTKADMGRIEDRRARLETRKKQLVAANKKAALEASKREQIHPRWLAYQIGQIMDDDAIMLDDAVSNSGNIRANHWRTQPGTYFRSGGSSGGWGVGAAIGAKLARPGSDVILAAGDGYFTFGSPLPALWTASHNEAPFLSVIFMNRSLTTGTTSLVGQYPDGAAVSAGDFTGGVFDPAPDFAKLAEAANCSGETVIDPGEVGPALRRGLDHVRNGTPALVAVSLPTLIEERALGGGRDAG